MRILITMAVLASALISDCDAVAQEENEAIRTFQDYFGAFIADEWDYQTHMTGANGETIYEGKDVRTYRFGMRGRFVVENVFGEDADGSRTHVAIQLIGIDTKTGTLSVSQFWPWQPTTLGDVTARLEQDASGKLQFAGSARPAGMQHPQLRFRCSFESADIYTCLTWTKDEGGADYQSNIETFTRRK